MANQLLVRNLPTDTASWIEEERKRGNLTQQEFVLALLEKAKNMNFSEQGRMFNRKKGAEKADFRFIDLFAGIGGFRIALENQGGECVFTSEWDKYAQKTYKAWFGEMPTGDIRKVNPSDIPDHDILAAGFPCQPFSIAGVSKKISLGRAHGFDDVKQGNLFFSIASIIKEKKPKIVFLENVKNLKSHDQGRTWGVIESTLTDLGYTVFNKIIDAAGWVPQHRERIFIVGFRKDVFGEDVKFEYPKPKREAPKLKDILEKDPLEKYILTPGLWDYLKKYAKKHKEAGNGFGFGMPDLDGVSRTLSARYYKDGSEILINRGTGKRPRRLTPRECHKLMGFPESCKSVVSDTQAYKQYGNAVVVPVVEAVASKIVEVLKEQN